MVLDRLRDLWRGKETPEERLAQLLDLQDPRFNIRPLESGDWLCPYCCTNIPAPHWDGDIGSIGGQEEICKHLLTCPVTVAHSRKPPLKNWIDLVEFTVKQRLAQWPNYSLLDPDGYWICPHCTESTTVVRKHWYGVLVPVEEFLPKALDHMRGCKAFAKAPLEPLTDIEITEKLGQTDARRRLLGRVANDPLFRVHDDYGHWIDPFSGRAIEDLNLFSQPWNTGMMEKIVEFLLSPKCTGARVNWRTPFSAEELHRLAGRISAERREATTEKHRKQDEVELEDLRGKVEQLQGLAALTKERDKELAAARNVQLKMLPDAPPLIDGFEVSAFYNPCAELGGDLFHFLPMQDSDHTGFLIGDVSGHGVDAALIMSMALKSFTLRCRESIDPVKVLGKVNEDLIPDIPQGRFLTATLAALDHRTGELHCGRAGHNPSYMLDPRTTQISEVTGAGLALGAVKPALFEKAAKPHTVMIPPNGIFLMYTDGVVEARDFNGNMYSEERLKEALILHRNKSSQEIVEGLVQHLRTFVAGHPFEDDVTFVVVRRAANPASSGSIKRT